MVSIIPEGSASRAPASSVTASMRSPTRASTMLAALAFCSSVRLRREARASLACLIAISFAEPAPPREAPMSANCMASVIRPAMSCVIFLESFVRPSPYFSVSFDQAPSPPRSFEEPLAPAAGAMLLPAPLVGALAAASTAAGGASGEAALFLPIVEPR